MTPEVQTGRWDCIALKPPPQMPSNVPNDCGSGAVKNSNDVREEAVIPNFLGGLGDLEWLTSRHRRPIQDLLEPIHDQDKQPVKGLIMTNPSPVKNLPLVDPFWLGSLGQ